MEIKKTTLPGVLIIEPRVFGDSRGFFMETYNQARYEENGIAKEGFVQDNLSSSKRGVLRGLHFQNPDPQGKLVYVLQGEVFDVAADIRIGSPTFGKWTGQVLSGENKRQLYVPPGFAHGFVVLSLEALFAYKCTTHYNQSTEAVIAWNDPTLDIDWRVAAPSLSQKDRAAPTLKEIDSSILPLYQSTKVDQE